jgi:hypothetical protein
MRILVKKNLIIFRVPEDWEAISARIVKEYGASMLISWKCRRELGFSVRHHKGLAKWDDNPYDDSGADYQLMKKMHEDFRNQYRYEDQVHLDFYNDTAMTFFTLKYLNNVG